MIAFTNTSTGGNSFKWYFGDGDSSFLNNPNHGYSVARCLYLSNIYCWW